MSPTPSRRSLLAALAGLTLLPPRAECAPKEEAAWKTLFNGTSLMGWKATPFTGAGGVKVEKSFRTGPGAIVVEAGATLTGFHWGGEAPRMGYEIELEVLKINGSDFMCGLTFPVGEAHVSLILGGWGGGLVGISSIDGHDASENDTTKYMSFVTDRWYRVRVRVTRRKIEAWLDEKSIVDQEITGKKLGLRAGEISLSVPIGICTYQTSAAYRAIRLRRL